MAWKPPVFKHFRSTDLLNAFVLNALATAVIATMTVVIDDELTILNDKYQWKMSNSVRRLIAFVLAFLVGLICYLLMYFFLGYGAGMIAAKHVKFIE
jgi:Mn2+/Fe2+ NRAMP family transporter